MGTYGQKPTVNLRQKRDDWRRSNIIIEWINQFSIKYSFVKRELNILYNVI